MILFFIDYTNYIIIGYLIVQNNEKIFDTEQFLTLIYSSKILNLNLYLKTWVKV